MNVYYISLIIVAIALTYYAAFPGGYKKWTKRKSEILNFKKSKGDIEDELRDDEII